MTRGAALFPLRRLVASVLTLIAVVAAPRAQEPPPDRSLAFDGSWSASGLRQTIPTENGQPAAIARVSGAVVLSKGSGLAAGFAAEAIAFDDGSSAMTGRAVWTDGSGDRIFSTLRGGPLQAKRRITGTITGGPGAGRASPASTSSAGSTSSRRTAGRSRVAPSICVDGFTGRTGVDRGGKQARRPSRERW